MADRTWPTSTTRSLHGPPAHSPIDPSAIVLGFLDRRGKPSEPGTKLLGALDSLAWLELFTKLDDAFGSAIAATDVSQCETVDDLVAYLERATSHPDNGP